MSKLKALKDELFIKDRFIIERLNVFVNNYDTLVLEKIIDKLSYKYYFQILFIDETNNVDPVESYLYLDYDSAFDKYKSLLFNYLENDAV